MSCRPCTVVIVLSAMFSKTAGGGSRDESAECRSHPHAPSPRESIAKWAGTSQDNCSLDVGYITTWNELCAGLAVGTGNSTTSCPRPPTHRSNAPRHALFRHKVLEALLQSGATWAIRILLLELPITSNFADLTGARRVAGPFQSTSTKLSPREASAASKLRSGPARIASMSSAASRCAASSTAPPPGWCQSRPHQRGSLPGSVPRRPHPDGLNTGCWIFSLLGKILRNWNSLSSFSLQQATPAL